MRTAQILSEKKNGFFSTPSPNQVTGILGTGDSPGIPHSLVLNSACLWYLLTLWTFPRSSPISSYSNISMNFNHFRFTFEQTVLTQQRYL